MSIFGFKRWKLIFSVSFLMFTIIFSQPLFNYPRILNASGQQNQNFNFFESFEEYSTTNLPVEEFDVEVVGDVLSGITSKLSHNGSNSLFVGPSTCDSFCFGDYSLKTTTTSIDLTNADYAISYWRRESNNNGGTISIIINGRKYIVKMLMMECGILEKILVGIADFFFYTGFIDTLSFWESDLISSNTIYIDDIVIQDANDINPSTMITTETPTETISSFENSETNQPDTTVIDTVTIDVITTSIDDGSIRRIVIFVALFVLTGIIVNTIIARSRSQPLRNYPSQHGDRLMENVTKTQIQFCGSCGSKF